ncbi:LLM class flavin-dependent oxidoreductase [Pseudochrobactrum sp. sp1633]|uniref:LLM class flavin-dependent oxidoreductase n=1 Tax=Pseudochrobactrum sp. sp1633 TaxID=3036706 RepID=UPI0025A59770|nr:LLM class flavin-dependent oxidoreductase [Pseudochrobactrum sp. sp1633]MDM8347170.1 LLM class flavin-dependent oxidoreductase [Pseudochrobactrum sp. sp1633]
MKIGLLQEGEVMPGRTVASRYEEMIAEVARADKLGFSSWGTSEQHFSPPRFTVSAPEVLYAAIARETNNITLRIMCAVLLQWNHPILVAERLATLDIVSKGRAEIATARSNNLTTLEAFGVNPSQTRAQWEDGMKLLSKLFDEDFEGYDGDFWKIPARTIVPHCVQRPHPAVSVAASSVDTHRMAGERGIGVLTFENYFGFDYLQECIDAYREGQSDAKPMFRGQNKNLGLYVATAFCAETKEEACRVARDVALGYFKFILDLYIPLGKRASYEYLDDKMTRLLENENNLDFLLTETPSVLIGTPDDFRKRLKDLEARGVDEVLLRIDGVPHEDIMKSLDLIGREVIPHFSGAKVAAE